MGEMTADKLGTHFELVNHQLLYVRAGIALAQLTGRILILPPIWCELDKYWAPLHNGAWLLVLMLLVLGPPPPVTLPHLTAGNIPGSKFRKPFICPMDHVLDIEGGWFPRKIDSEFGPQVSCTAVRAVKARPLSGCHQSTMPECFFFAMLPCAVAGGVA